MQRRIEQTNSHGQAGHRAQDLDEVFLLGDAQLFERGRFFGRRVGQNHPTHNWQAIWRQEHVLGATQADALSSVFAGLGCVFASVGVGPHLHLALAYLVGPLQDRKELTWRLGGGQRHFA